MVRTLYEQATTLDKRGEATMTTLPAKQAILHRMVMDSHVCPYGIKAKDLLRRYRVGNAYHFRPVADLASALAG